MALIIIIAPIVFTRFLSFHIAGSNAKGAISILSCILARQLCFEDSSCAAILEIIPRVCGTVPGKHKHSHLHHLPIFCFIIILNRCPRQSKWKEKYKMKYIPTHFICSTTWKERIANRTVPIQYIIHLCLYYRLQGRRMPRFSTHIF